MDDEQFGRHYGAAFGFKPWMVGETAYWYDRDMPGVVVRELKHAHPEPPDSCDEPLRYETESQSWAALGEVVRKIQAALPAAADVPVVVG